MKKVNWYLVLLSFAGLFVYGLIDNGRGPIFPEFLASFHLTDTEGSAFFFLTSLFSTLVNATAFYWLKRWRPIVSFRFFALLQIASLLVLALSPSFPVFLIGVAMLGATLGGIGLLVNVLVASSTEGDLRRRAMSGLHAMYGISSLLAPIAVTGIYMLEGSWRAVLGAFALGPLFVAVFSFKKVEVVVIDGPTAKDGATESVSFLRASPFVLMVVAYVVAEVLIGSRLVLYSRRELGLSAEHANLMLSGYFLAMFAGRMLFALVSVPVSTRILLGISATIGILSNIAGLMGYPAAFIVSGFAFSYFYPCALADANERLGPSRGQVVISWIQTFQTMALMAMHFTVGLLSDRFGLGKALWLGPAALVIVILGLIFGFSLGEKVSRTRGISDPSLPSP